jgi:hypothetical protein
LNNMDIDNFIITICFIFQGTMIWDFVQSYFICGDEAKWLLRYVRRYNTWIIIEIMLYVLACLN